MNPTPDTRLAAQPFVLNLPGNDYTLTTEELEAQLDAKLLRKTTSFSPHLQFKSLRGTQLTLLNSFQEQQYLLLISIEAGSLAVSCSCNEPVHTLCLHSYRALRSIAVFKGNSYFKQFAPGGLAVTAAANKKAFAFNSHRIGPEIVPLPPHGKIYGINCSLSVKEGLVQTTQLLTGSGHLVCYLILSFSSRRLPPILMPCLALPAKTNNRAKSFLSFTASIAADKAHYFTDSQKMLNRLCLAMLKEVEHLEKTVEWQGRTWHWEQYHKLFQLWQQCWPLLGTQTQVYYSHLYRLQYIKTKPRIRETIPIHIAADKVYPQFELKQFPDHYRLSMHIPHNSKQLRSEAGILPFFVNCPETDCFYLLPSLSIAQLVAQMHDAVPFISIFKQQYKSFQQQVVAPLQKQKLLVITKHKIPKPKKQRPGKGTRSRKQGTSAS